MDVKKLKQLVGSVLVVTAGVLVAFQVQSYLAKQGVQAPAEAE
tara:strand:+ start:268 stop:396 length:129 start_codon:yes stop_codon:yes gene_type:complete